MQNANFEPTPDPDCRWCKGSGEITLATTTQPCLDCIAPYEGWVWADGRSLGVVVYYLDMDGNEIKCHGVQNVENFGHLPTDDGRVSVGRVCKFSRSGEGRSDWMKNPYMNG